MKRKFRLIPKLLHVKKEMFSKVKREYFDGYLYPKHYTHFNDIYQHLKEFTCSPTERDIKFLDLEFGVTKRKARSVFGEPIYRKLLPCNENKYMVYFYFMKLGSYRTLAQLHFLDNYFFYGHINFSSDNLIKSSDVEMIKKIIYSKYIGTTNEVIQISDKNKNRLYIENNVNFTINYMAGSEIIKEKLFLICNSNTEKSNKKQIATQKILKEAL